MATQYIPASGGLSENCRLFLSDGRLVNVAQIKPGDLLLSAEGTASEVELVVSYNGSLVKITQMFQHDKDDLQAGCIPCGVIELTVSDTQELFLRTKQRVKRSWKKNRPVIEITQLREVFLNGFGKLVQPFSSSKTFIESRDVSEIRNHIKRATALSTDGYYYWKSLEQNLGGVAAELRKSTKLLFSPVKLKVPVLKRWMDNWFGEDVSAERVDAMAWLLGFWIGDGYKRGALFALHFEDHDVNDRLRLFAGRLGMSLTITRKDPLGFRAEGVLHTADGSRDKHSPLTNCLKSLLFLKDGKIDDPKNIPDCLRFETRSVREYFMAGLVDSDGCTILKDGTCKVAIKSAFPLVKDGIIAVARSLGLNLTVSFEPETERENFHQSDTWTIHWFEGNNRAVFWAILAKCSCERKRNPKRVGHCRTVLYPPDQVDEPARWNMMPVSFNTSKVGTGQLYAVYLKDRSGTFITEEQMVCGSASLKIVHHEKPTRQRSESYFKDEKNFCLSCCRARDSRFELVPWDLASLWCDNCRNRYQLTGIICTNERCRTIPSEDEAKRIRAAANAECLMCGSAVKDDSSGLQKRTRLAGKCVNCGATEATRWLKLKWDKKRKERLCKKCHDAHLKTGKHCAYCCKIFDKFELEELMTSLNHFIEMKSAGLIWSSDTYRQGWCRFLQLALLLL